MKLRSLARRPSPAIVISSVALFMSIGGVGYAATALPANSVGTSQIQNNAVNYTKIAPSSVGRVRLTNDAVTNAKMADNAVGYQNIIPGSVGYKRADLNQLQARIGRGCGSGSAIGSVSSSGTPTCVQTVPGEYGSANTTTALPGGVSTPVASATLGLGPNYLAFADTQLTVTSGGTAGKVIVDCTLTVGSGSQTRAVGVDVDATSGDGGNAALPLQVAGTTSGSGGTTTESCEPTSAPTGATVEVTSNINAIATAANNN